MSGASIDEKKFNEKGDNLVTLNSGSTTHSLGEDDYVFGQLDEGYRQKLYEKLGHGNLDSGERIPDIEYLFEKTDEMPISRALEILKESLVYHEGDPNFPIEDFQLIGELAQGLENNTNMSPEDWAFQTKMLATLNEFHSPYPEVRAISSPLDDPTLPVETIRAYFLGFFWTIIGTAINEFFTHRQPAITITSSVCQMLLYPCGKFLEKVLPDWGFTLFGTRHSLNPCPWSYKEQMFATIIFNVAIGGVYVSSNIYVQKLDIFYGSKWVNIGYEILLTISTQTLGIGFAGILRKVAIYPVKSVWPTLLPTLALNQALLKPEHKETIHGWSMSRYKFFFIFCAGSFSWFWLPDYLFTALSTFNWTTWIAPQNFNLAAITGSVTGLGLNPWSTFDWNVLSFNAPLATPFYTQVNFISGSIICFFCIVGVYYSNYKWTGYLPINSNSVFSNTGTPYNVQKVITNGKLDVEKYKKYGPPYYSAANLVLYGAYFAMYPFTIIYTCYTDWMAISASLKSLGGMFTSFGKSNFENFKDPHSRMMAKYKETPDWWFMVIIAVSLVFAILCVKLYPANTPVWGIFFTIGINVFFLIPITIIYSVTGFTFGLNVLVELIIGYAIPGNGDALMTLKAFGYNIGGQAENFITDQKIAHYSKIPPRAIFRGQMIAIGLQILTSLLVISWETANIAGICTPDQPDKFTCPSERTYYSSSVLWGVIGPQRVFGPLYPILKWCFLIGAVLAVACILLKKYFKKQTQYFFPTTVIGGFLIYAPYNLSYYLPGVVLGFIFNYWIKTRKSAWWEKYNYILSSALDTGVAFSAIIIFFAVQLKEVDVNWWGNIVSSAGIDGGNGQQSLLSPTSAPDGYFGLRYGTFE
ncbi:hypothetical protein DASC09_049420 [Saccharomycopsis crataegensis]|uniref:OPT family small oligopeptide transporter n=1 Tax=Saccharomycopsis crataegensis TaxID=43959 RepID=A0AAV5QRV7_9ASCO|nr:hypothetical protein DASC09_049420 [Saccharomycopsis crataegensis]